MKDMDIFPTVELTATPVIDAAIIVAAAIVAAVIADLFVTRVLARLVRTTSSEVDDRIVALLRRPVFLSVLLFGGSMALKVLEAHSVFFRLFQTFFALVWIVAFLRISLVLSGALPTLVSGDSRAGQHLGTLVKNLTAVVLLSLGVMAVLSIWQVSITPLLASAGIVGAAVAFASKDTIANFLGGISILVDRPYSVGNYIILDGGERGEVVDIGLRSTRIKTRDDVLVTVPNSVMANSKIVNESAPITRFRIRIPVGVAYGTDIHQVEELLLNIAKDSTGVENEPAPRVRFRTFGDSALAFELLCWVDDPMNKGRIRHDLNKEIYETFNRENIVIPFPQRDVHHYGGTERDPGPQGGSRGGEEGPERHH